LVADTAGNNRTTSHLKGENDVEAFREKLFASVGQPASFQPGEFLISEGKASDSAIFIRKGTCKVLKGTKDVATRAKGDLIGEMTLLLGDLPGVTIQAESAVDVYIVGHSGLAEKLSEDPKLCGRVFRMMAATLSERISEASSKM